MLLLNTMIDIKTAASDGGRFVFILPLISMIQ